MAIFNCNLLSRYRSCLMGASAILIILCHAPASIDFPRWISAILSRGGWGVDIFLFLSGLGLFYSLSSSDHATLRSLRRWYAKRFKRLLIPYALSYIPLCTLRGIIRGESLMNVLGDISTISFWTRHSGAWFVALIIPLYLIAPLLYSAFIRIRSDKHKFIFMISLVTLCLFFGAYEFRGVEYRSLIYNIQFAVSRVPSFIFGMYAGCYVINQYKLKHPLFCCFIVLMAACGLKYYVPTLAISCFLALPTMFILILVFSKELKPINRLCSFMGEISLESYLFNGILPFYIVNKTFRCCGINLFYGNYLPYLLVIVLGIAFSYIVHRFSIMLTSPKAD